MTFLTNRTHMLGFYTSDVKEMSEMSKKRQKEKEKEKEKVKVKEKEKEKERKEEEGTGTSPMGFASFFRVMF